jgi:hypothetical protein
MAENKLLARQVFPPGLAGDLMYRASQMIPLNPMGALQDGQIPQMNPQEMPPSGEAQVLAEKTVKAGKLQSVKQKLKRVQ